MLEHQHSESDVAPEVSDSEQENLRELAPGEKYKGSEVRNNIVCCRTKKKKYMCCGWWNKVSAVMYDICENEKF